jgi:hypothetical protein
VRIALAYIAVTHGPIVDEYCARFVATFKEYPPGADCDLLIICNGGPLNTSTSLLFSGTKARMFPRENDAGFDITGYLAAARGPCAGYDAMLCCGESVYFHREGWLRRLVAAWDKYGPGMYGVWASNGPRAHINTTAFLCAPSLLLLWPTKPESRDDRYRFEHGSDALWRRAARQKWPTMLVTWDGEWGPREWRRPADILWRGTQQNCLMSCYHTDHWDHMSAKDKANWSKWADTPFR